MALVYAGSDLGWVDDGTGGLSIGDFYHTAAGAVMIVV